jgi:hypothetical protein
MSKINSCGIDFIEFGSAGFWKSVALIAWQDDQNELSMFENLPIDLA